MGAFSGIKRKLKRYLRGPLTLEQRRTEWIRVHQPFELDFHRQPNYRWDESQFASQWNAIYGDLMGLTPEHFHAGQTLLDLGCGSRPCLDWFDEGPKKCFLDPLLDSYRQIEEMSQYWDDRPADTLFSVPAEKCVTALEGQCDLVTCWNVLDHTYDWRAILENIRRYSKPGALICIGTDFEEGGKGHPGIDDVAYFWHFIDSHFKVVTRREDFIYREVALKLVRL